MWSAEKEGLWIVYLYWINTEREREKERERARWNGTNLTDKANDFP